MKRVALSRLLASIALIAIAPLALFAGTLTYQSWWRYEELVRASSLVRLAVATSQFAVVALPAEGATSRAYLVDGDKAKLEAQRRITDEFYRTMRARRPLLPVASITPGFRNVCRLSMTACLRSWPCAARSTPKRRRPRPSLQCWFAPQVMHLTPWGP